MILKSLRIENFKCIEDSGQFPLDRVTCLVGKNESGKSASLEALYKLNPVVATEANFNQVIEYPRRHWSEYKERRTEDPANVLTTVWELEDSDRAAVAETLGPKGLKSSTVKVGKGYSNKQYWTVEPDEKEVVSHYLGSGNLFKEEHDQLKDAKTIEELTARLKAIQNPSERVTQLLKTLEEKFPKGKANLPIIDFLSKRVPKFVYFEEYGKMPGQVAIDDLVNRKQQNLLKQGDRIFLALLDLAGTSVEEISRIGKFEELIAELEGVSNRLTATIFEYWRQNRHLKVEFRFDAARPEDPPPFNSGYIFRTRIENTRHGVTVSFDERSTGFVWFFSFLVWFSHIRKEYGENLLILLDEPGLGLHGKAQQDLLRFINEKLKPSHQVIYSAHSPFMVDPDALLSVRTIEDVVKDDQILGTKIKNEIFSTEADTRFPLQAALGYEITQSLFVGKNNLLVEGPSDFLYLKWFSHELQSRGRTFLDPRWTVAPCGGVDKVGSFVALFGGSELNIAVLTDFHEGEKKKVRSLRESQLLKAGQVFSAEMYTGTTEADLEDMIGRDFYAGLMKACFSLTGGQALPSARLAGAATRVVKEVQDHFATLPPTAPSFDHYTPAVYLTENGATLRNTLPGLDAALDRFEHFFKDVNGLLPA